MAAYPLDPLGFSLAAAAPFYNFIGIRFRSERGNSLQNLITGSTIEMPSAMQHDLARLLRRARELASSDQSGQNSVFALCIAEGVYLDLMALVLRRWQRSLRHAQQATLHARRLLSLNPAAYDAYFVIGISEHILVKVPAVFKPFTSIPGIVGNTGRAIQFLEAAAHRGWYFREFARQTLVTVYTEERRPQDALRMLTRLTDEFPGNAGYRKDWHRLSSHNGL